MPSLECESMEFFKISNRTLGLILPFSSTRCGSIPASIHFGRAFAITKSSHVLPMTFANFSSWSSF